MAQNIEIKQLIIYGDSILRGVTYTPGDFPMGRYHICRDKIRLEGIKVINRSKMGQTIDWGLERIEKDAADGILGPGTVALIEYGGNDCDHDWDAVENDPGAENPPKMGREDYKRKMRLAVEKVRKTGAEPVICSLIPIDSDKYFTFITEVMKRDSGRILQFLGYAGKLGEDQALYSSFAENIAEECGCRLLPLRHVFTEPELVSVLSEDGVHPTEEGYAAVHRFIEKYVLSI